MTMLALSAPVRASGLSALGQAALAYARAGCFVFPLLPQGKEPWARTAAFQAPPGEGGYKLATTNVKHLTEAWTLETDCNIGLRPGPSGFLVADIDDDFAAFVAAAVGLVGEPRPTVLTSRGRHLYCPHPTPAIGKLNLTLHGDRLAKATKGDPALELIGWKGYVVVPPSVHPDGTIYRWVV